MGSTGKEIFFLFENPFIPRAVGTSFGYQPVRDIDKVLRGEIVPSVPVSCLHFSGSKYCDVVWAGLRPLVHDRVIEVLTVGGISGWSTYEAQIFDKNGKAISGYHGLSITGRCAITCFGEGYSEIVYEAGPSGIPMKHYKGLGLEGWDGSDVFMPSDENSIQIFTTAAVKDLAEKKKISNVEFKDISAFKLLASQNSQTG